MNWIVCIELIVKIVGSAAIISIILFGAYKIIQLVYGIKNRNQNKEIIDLLNRIYNKNEQKEIEISNEKMN